MIYGMLSGEVQEIGFLFTCTHCGDNDVPNSALVKLWILLSKQGPRIRGDGKYGKDLGGMEASKRGLIRITGGKECGQLGGAATLALDMI